VSIKKEPIEMRSQLENGGNNNNHVKNNLADTSSAFSTSMHSSLHGLFSSATANPYTHLPKAPTPTGHHTSYFTPAMHHTTPAASLPYTSSAAYGNYYTQLHDFYGYASGGGAHTNAVDGLSNAAAAQLNVAGTLANQACAGGNNPWKFTSMM
jgi:hypothetical protein